MAWSLVQATAPTAEPISVAEVHTQARIDATDEDSYISSFLIPTARELCESFTGRAFINSTWRYCLDEWPCGRILRLPRAPLVSITTLKYLDENATEQTIVATSYTAHTDPEPGFIEMDQDYAWPALYGDSGDVRVTYIAGYGAAGTNVPATIRLALLKTVAYWFDNRQEIGALPPDVRTLLSDYKVGAFAWP